LGKQALPLQNEASEIGNAEFQRPERPVLAKRSSSSQHLRQQVVSADTAPPAASGAG